jgi:UDP-2,4-diacetamido-2,4,6-trideoxy-beta-L-altropyranose hydrolase
MKVFIRADASTQIGTGHVMRCLTLAGDLKLLGMEVSFISRVLPGDLCDYVESKGFKVYRLNTVENRDGDYWEWLTENWLEDARKTQEILLKQVTDRADITNINEESSGLNKRFTDPADTTNISSRIAAELFSAAVSSSKAGLSLNLVVDSYALDSKWEKYLRPHINKIMIIDDLANRVHDCDLLLDQNYYRNMDRRYEGLVPSACKMLLGTQYALLRPEFHQAKKNLRKRDGKVRRILVFFGGSDPTNETKKALEAIKLLNRPEIAVDVVVGAINPHKEEIKKICSEMSNTTYYCQVENMAELMVAADLAIGAGGATTWERLYLELPTIAIAVAENQVETLEALGEEAVLSYLGFYCQISPVKLANRIQNRLGPQ